MADTFAIGRSDFFARGFQFLNDAGAGLVRTKSLYNSAYLELCEEEKWPFLLTSASGAAPLTVADMREVESVRDTGQLSVKLWHRPATDIEEDYGLLTTVGSPLWYYIENSIIRTYPVGGTLSVRYYKVPAELVNDADEPLVPNRFRRYIVEGMIRQAAMEDNPQLAQAAEAERQIGLNLMRRSLLFQAGPPQFSRNTVDSLDS